MEANRQKDEFIILREPPRFETLKAQAARYPDLDASAVETCILMLQVLNDVMAAAHCHFARHGISQGRFVILMLLNRTPGEGVSPSELSEMARVTRATITGLLDGLEDDGFVERRERKNDRRSNTVWLTDKGRQFLDGMMPDHCQRLAALMGHLSEEERTLFRSLLGKVAAGIPAMRDPCGTALIPATVWSSKVSI